MPVDHYENFPVASVLVPKRLRGAIEAIYWFARSADDIADEGDDPPALRLAELDAYRARLDSIGSGVVQTDAQWSRLEPLLPTDVRGRKRVDDRRVLSGIVHALRCGGRWADCADVYGPKKTLYNRFVRWSERGVWERLFSALAGPEDAPDRLFIDSSCIKVHRCAGGGKGGVWRMVSASPKAAATPSSMPSATTGAAPSSCSLHPAT